MKRLLLAWADLVASVRLFHAQVRHNSALGIVHDARQELDRAIEMAQYTKRLMEWAADDAKLAAMKVRRQRQRSAVGLR